MRPSAGMWSTLPRATPLRNTECPSQQLSIANSSSASGKTLYPRLFFTIGFPLPWGRTGLMRAGTAMVRSYVQLPGCVYKELFPCSHRPPPVLTIFWPPPLKWNFWVWYTHTHTYIWTCTHMWTFAYTNTWNDIKISWFLVAHVGGLEANNPCWTDNWTTWEINT